MQPSLTKSPVTPNGAETRDTNFAKYSSLAAGLVLMLCMGILYMWSVFQPYVVAEFGWRAGDVGMTSSIMVAVFVIGNIVSGSAQKRFKPMAIIYTGLVMFTFGMYLTSLLDGSSPLMLYLTYSVISGFGSGLAYSVVLSVLQKWFAARSGLATGLVVGFFGLSTVAMTPLAESLLARYGIRATFCIFAIAFIIICYICSLFIRMPSDEYIAEESAKVSRGGGGIKQYSPGEMLKTPMAYLLMMGMFFNTSAYMILVPYIKMIATGRGMSNEFALAAVMISGMANAAGRITVPTVSDKIGRIRASIICACVGIAGCLLMIFATGFPYLIAVFLIAVSYGGCSGISPVMSTQVFGAKNSGTNYGIIMLSLALSSVVFGKIASVVGTASVDGFTTVFIICAGLSVLPILAMLVLRKLLKKQGRMI